MTDRPVTEPELSQLWRKLTHNQRLLLINQVVPHDVQVRQAHFIAAARGLERRGVSESTGRAVADWALSQGYAQFVGTPSRGYAQWPDGQWTLTTPSPPRKRGRVDPDRLAELTAAGCYAAEIAEKLGVTREAVRLAAKRHGLTLARKPLKPKPVKQPRVLHPHRLVFAVSDDELSAIQEAAAQRGLTISAYLREVCAPIDDDGGASRD